MTTIMLCTKELHARCPKVYLLYLYLPQSPVQLLKSCQYLYYVQNLICTVLKKHLNRHTTGFCSLPQKLKLYCMSQKRQRLQSLFSVQVLLADDIKAELHCGSR